MQERTKKDKRMTISLGADHGGFSLKEDIRAFLDKKGIAYIDHSPKLIPGDDYPPIARKVARHVLQDKTRLGILLCGSGLGMDIAANRLKGARAATVRSVKEAKLSRQDDAANILVLGGRLTSSPLAKRIVMAWLTTQPSRAERHQRRVKELDRL